MNLPQEEAEDAPRCFRFADFELCTSPAVLTRSGAPVALQPQPARALSLLVSRAGDVVTRDQLRDHLWGKDHHLDVEQGINFTIRRIRGALNDDAADPRFLETLPKVGYRFVAPVDELTNGSAPQAPAVATTARRRPLRAAAAVVATVLALLAVGFLSRRGQPAEPQPDVKLAVLPFTAASVDAVDSTLPAVLTEELTTDLAQRLSPRLGVISLRSARTTGTGDRVEDAGARLGAKYLLRGNVGRLDGRLRITVRLWRVDDGVHLWARAFEPTVAELPEWHADVARGLAGVLGIEAWTPPPTVPRPQIPAQAYETYLQGRYLIGQSGTEEIERGLQWLREAITLAPDLAVAHAALADGSMKYHARRPGAELSAQAETATRRALELDLNLLEARAVLAEVLFYHRLDWESAGRELERILDLNPRSVRALHTYGLYLSSLGRHDEAISFVRRAVDLDPATVYVSSDLAQIYFWARRYEDAAARARANLELDPGDHPSRACLIDALFARGDHADALRESNLLLLALGLPQAATREEANQAALEHLLELAADGRPLDLQIAALLLARGEESLALDRLEQACRERRHWTVPFLAVDPRFDAVREHPRYLALGDCLAPLAEPS